MSVLLEVGEVVAAPPTGRRVLRLDDNGAMAIVAPDGTETSVGQEAATAAAPADATTFTALLNPATALLKGLATYDMKAAVPKPLALADGDTSVTPGSSHVSRLILPAGTLTGNGSVTLSLAGVTQGDYVEVVILDTSANPYIVKNSVGGTIYTKTASLPAHVVPVYANAGEWIQWGNRWWVG